MARGEQPGLESARKAAKLMTVHGEDCEIWGPVTFGVAGETPQTWQDIDEKKRHDGADGDGIANPPVHGGREVSVRGNQVVRREEQRAEECGDAGPAIA